MKTKNGLEKVVACARIWTTTTGEFVQVMGSDFEKNDKENKIRPQDSFW